MSRACWEEHCCWATLPPGNSNWPEISRPGSRWQWHSWHVLYRCCSSWWIWGARGGGSNNVLHWAPQLLLTRCALYLGRTWHVFSAPAHYKEKWCRAWRLHATLFISEMLTWCFVMGKGSLDLWLAFPSSSSSLFWQCGHCCNPFFDLLPAQWKRTGLPSE